MKLQFSPFRPHPWHGLEVGKNPPLQVTAFIEITSVDGIKYEIDKSTGYLKVDRPQLSSSLPPSLYGFIPRTYCGKRIGALAGSGMRGDGDPLDICVISERPVTRSEVLVPVRVIGGLRVIDRNEADDKIIALMESDPVSEGIRDLEDLPSALLTRLKHYFLTYKLIPGQADPPVVEIAAVYGKGEAARVIQASIEDYRELIEGSAAK
jgi:inorganic pyrophosphatase